MISDARKGQRMREGEFYFVAKGKYFVGSQPIWIYFWRAAFQHLDAGADRALAGGKLQHFEIKR